MRASTQRGRIVALAAATTVAAATQALGAGTPTIASAPRLTAVPAVVRPGGMLTLRGSGFPRATRLTLLAAPPHRRAVRIGSAVTGSRGGFPAAIRIRSRSAPGSFVATACSARCRVKASARFRIAAP